MNHESECRVINKADTQRIDAYEESWMARLCQKCQRPSHTDQPPLSSIIESRRLTFFGHLARMDENADAIAEPGVCYGDFTG